MSYTLPILVSDAPPASPGTPPPAPSAARTPGTLYDSHGRVIRDLRLSVTDRCNYRCIYCMDPGHRYMPKQQLLRLEEYLALARVCVSLGIEKIRVTGGEPTLYPDLDALLAGLGRLPLHDLAMTTNGSLITGESARRWQRLGLCRLTLSLDSLRPERTAQITRTKSSPDIIVRAIRIARAAGLDPIKVNAVIMRGINDDEVADFADFAREHEIDMRLIEWMPLDSGHAWGRGKVVSAAEMLDRIRKRHDLFPIEGDDPHSTSVNFTFGDGSRARLGIIASVTRAFCGACSRMRITADGKIRPCLFSHDEWDLRPLLRSSASDADLSRFIIDAMWTKQRGHGIDADDFVPPARGMSAIGG